MAQHSVYCAEDDLHIKCLLSLFFPLLSVHISDETVSS